MNAGKHEIFYDAFDSPAGPLWIAIGPDGLCRLTFAKSDTSLERDLRFRFPGATLHASPERCREARRQIEEYFTGRRHSFDVPLAHQGTSFQRAVWDALRKIPYGRTTSYGEVARRIGRPRAARAVGMANHRNPVAIVVPCHRVIGTSGALVGYGSGLDCKRFLLDLERRHAAA